MGNELRAKVHFRRAEAHEAAGEAAKAMTSLRAVLDIDSANVDARNKWSKLKQEEAERRERERSLFAGKLATSTLPEAPMEEKSYPATAATFTSDAEEFFTGDEASLEDARKSRAMQLSSFTDRAAASRLSQSLSIREPSSGEPGSNTEHALNCNFFVGPQVQLFGNIRTSDGT